MKKINEVEGLKQNRPIKIIQFGEGNFLRAFCDWMVQKLNDETDFNGNIAVVQPLEQGLCQMLADQDHLYTHYLNGIKNGEVISESYVNNTIESTINPYTDPEAYLSLATIESARFIISNTTEAGIAYEAEDQLNSSPQKSFPGKLTALLYKRFLHFKGATDKGFIIIPCELIESNGDHLKEIVLKYAEKWSLDEAFIQWINKGNVFCNSLVDRIVPGFPRDHIGKIQEDLGYIDNLVVESEQFNLWVIEGPESIQNEFPIHKTDCNVLFVEDMTPYRTRKVRILNGAHTTLVPISYLYGIDTVRESVEDEVIGQLIKSALFKEIIPTLSLSKEELEVFANDVIDRFKNPFIQHFLLSISLNSMSKYKTRVLPSLMGYLEKNGALPKILSLGLASMIVFYKGERNGQVIPLNDSQDVLDLYSGLWSNYNGAEEATNELVQGVLAYEAIWQGNLNDIPGLSSLVASYVTRILNEGMVLVAKEVLESTL